jgi:hypothetical protein
MSTSVFILLTPNIIGSFSMMYINEITVFFGWCTVVNMFIYTFSALFIIVFKDFTTSLHSKLMGMNASELPLLYFTYMGNYKIGIIIFNLTPYIALKLMV